MVKLMRMLERGGRRCAWLFKQCVWHVGRLLEMAILDATSPAEEENEVPDSEKCVLEPGELLADRGSHG